MRKNAKLIVLAATLVIAIVITIVCVYFNSIEKGNEFALGKYTVISEDSGISIVSYSGEETSLIIPAKIEGKKVVSIRAGAFNNSKITNLSFAEDAKDIQFEEKCFADNTILVSVNLPSNMSYIPDYSFYKCTALKNVTMPDSIKYIGAYSFYGCTALSGETLVNSYEYLSLPKNLEEICDYAFYDCDKLDCVYVTSKLTTIGNSAFRDSSLQKISLYDDANEDFGITTIGSYAFYKTYLYSQSSTDEFYLPKLETIGTFAFSSTSNNFKYFRVAPSVTKIGDYAFSGSTSLTTIAFEQEKETETIELGNYLLSSCTKLVSVSLPNKISKIPEGTFMGCIRLLYTNNLVLGEDVNEIGKGAFALFATASTETKYCNKTIVFKKDNGNGVVSHVNYNDYFKITALDEYKLDTELSTSSYNHFIITDYDSIKLYAYIGLYSDAKEHYSIGDGSSKVYLFKFLEKSTYDTIVSIEDYAFAGAQFTQLFLPTGINSLGSKILYSSEIDAICFQGSSVYKETFTIADDAFEGNGASNDIECFIVGRSYITALADSALKARLDELGIDCGVLNSLS